MGIYHEYIMNRLFSFFRLYKVIGWIDLRRRITIPPPFLLLPSIYIYREGGGGRIIDMEIYSLLFPPSSSSLSLSSQRERESK